MLLCASKGKQHKSPLLLPTCGALFCFYLSPTATPPHSCVISLLFLASFPFPFPAARLIDLRFLHVHYRKENKKKIRDKDALSESSRKINYARFNRWDCCGPGEPCNELDAVFPTVQSVRLEPGRRRTTFCRPVPSSSQIARQFRVEDVGPHRPPPSPPIIACCNVLVSREGK